MIKPWIFEFFRAPTEDGTYLPLPERAGVTPQDALTHTHIYWDRWMRAEAMGFEGIFFSEHHFGAGYSPSPNLLIAALSRVTTTLRLGVMGVVLPYYEPWRVIEEIGMLDHLCNGRLEVGTASGIPPEMAQVGLTGPRANQRNNEAQDLLDWALTHPGEPINHQGEIWTFKNLKLVPRPFQSKPGRWTTVVSEASARRSARRGTKIATGFSSVEQVNKIFDGYREEAAATGLEVTPESFGLRRLVTISRDGDEARAIKERTKAQVETMFHGGGDGDNHGPVPDAPQKGHGAPATSDDDFIAGNPREVAEQIIAQCQAVGAKHFLAMLEGHGSTARNGDAYDLFGQEVVPLLRNANVFA